MKRLVVLISVCCCVLLMQASIHNVKDYGARADGVTIDSPAINRAISAAAGEGGGTVYIPAGEYVCYSIRLASHVHLYLEQGARIIAASPTPEGGYDEAEPNEHNRYQDFGHSHWKNSLIWGIGIEDVTISGPGLIYGRGLTREESRLSGVGNKAISLKLCKNITLKDFSMLRCGHFALLATGVDNLSIINLKVDTNRDGFDIDCCKNVRIMGCSVNSPWDDAIVLKASYALGSFRDTENVTISDCYVTGYDRGTMLDATWQRDEPQAPDHGYVTGRIKLGTESSGGFKTLLLRTVSLSVAAVLPLKRWMAVSWKILLSAISIFIIREAIRRKMASVFRLRMKRLIRNHGCSALFRQKVFISVMHRE